VVKILRKINKTPYYSYRIGKLPKGCQLCVKGEKTVLFVTGLCSRKPYCYFCPVSDRKLGRDVVYVNEWQTRSFKDLVTEVKLCSSKGMGITGGDPLMNVERCVKYIKFVKKEFGKRFHVHLYTPLVLVNDERLEKLFKAGLDEIRFHPNFDDSKLWENMKFAKRFDWDVGVEIPVVPGKEKEIFKLVDFIKNNVDFINLNELEVADNKVNKLVKLGFSTKDCVSYAVKGSEKLAKELLEYCSRHTNLDAHYCSSKLKDKIQLAERIKKRARGVKRKFDRVTEEGMLIRGAIYLKRLVPSTGYRRKLENADKEKTVKELEGVKRKIEERFDVGKGLMDVDKEKLRILIDVKVLKRIKSFLGRNNLIGAIVEEYPTHDQTEIEIEFLSS